MKKMCLMVLLGLMLTSGCIFPSMWGRPGYGVDISAILKNREDLEEVNRFIASHGFQPTLPERLSLGWFVKNYERLNPEIKEKIFIVLDYKPVNGFWKSEMEFGLLISNAWEGKRNPVLKREIDELGDLFYGFLVDKGGREKIKIKRTPLTPPF